MSNEERIEKNKSNGFILVGEVKGLEVYKKSTVVGGYMYYTESSGIFTCILDTSIIDLDELELILKDAYNINFEKA
jgi:hypothetical protein